MVFQLSLKYPHVGISFPWQPLRSCFDFQTRWRSDCQKSSSKKFKNLKKMLKKIIWKISTKTWFSCDVTSPQNPLKQQVPIFWLQKWIELSHFSQGANLWLSSYNFGEVAVIQKFQYFQNSNGVLYGAAMLDEMGFCGHVTSWWKPSIAPVCWHKRLSDWRQRDWRIILSLILSTNNTLLGIWHKYRSWYFRIPRISQNIRSPNHSRYLCQIPLETTLFHILTFQP